MTQSFAGVYLLDAPYAIDRVYDYAIPRSMCDEVRRGSFVTVPFGKSNRCRLALVTEIKTLCDCESQAAIKPLSDVLGERASLSETMVDLCLYIKEQTLCTVGDAVRAMMPAAALSQGEEIYLPVPDTDKIPCDGGCAEDVAVLEYLRMQGRETTQKLRSLFGSATDEALRRLRRRGLVTRDTQYESRDAARYQSCHRLRVDPEQARAVLDGTHPDVKLRSDKHRALLALLLEQDGPVPDKQLCEAVGCTPSVLSTLTKKGLLAEHKELLVRDPYAKIETEPARPITLNEEQQAAYDTLCALAGDGQGHGVLLHGVTGSGKTSVMLRFIATLREQGKGAIVLLPEIALTPQTIAVFRSHFGQSVAVIHSGLSAGERYDAYERVRRGEADVVVGTRSAVFAPLPRLGAIIIDEEQEHTYKSDKNPKYRAHDVARFRCAAERGVMLLCSATPSLESYYKAVQGTYTLLKLKKRYGGALLPEVIVADTRRDSSLGGSLSPLGTLLCERLSKALSHGQQSILFLNRRGYHRFVSCRSCGEALCCERCSVAMTYHTHAGDYSRGELVCHFCGARAPVPARCPSCGSEHLTHSGFGTQRVEQELSSAFPSARVIRMDTDTTSTKFSYDRLLSRFRAHEADVLLGTQMVTKGHDFPDVSLVGVLSADASLYLDDYRAGERTFAQLTQVIGRAGRSKTPGLAVIQTANPDHDVIRLACAQDYETFYEREIKLRRLLVFPPFCDLALLTLSCKDEKQLLLSAQSLHDELRTLLTGEYADVKTVVFGPFEAPVYRVDGQYRMRTLIKCRLNKRSRALLSRLMITFGARARDTSLSVDLNPSSL